MIFSLLPLTFGAISLASSVKATVITDDSFFYGLSPPVYPSPSMSGRDDRETAHSKASYLVSQMTLEERANISVGYGVITGCTGITGTVPRFNWTGLCLSDAGNGLRNTDFVNGYPSGIHVGASWNRDLAYWRAFHMGGEFKTKGVQVALGPVVAPLGRVAEGGRNWEAFGTDPYINGQLASKTVRGIQDAGVMASVKHFIAYEQETNRQPVGNVSSVSSNVDDRTLHEMYLWPFSDAVQAGVGSVMCSYNRINSSYACQNSKVLNGLLKTELGFEGFVVSDWGAEHSGIASAEAGLDLVMPNSSYRGLSGEFLVQAVKNGSLEESRITDIATRILASWFQMKQDTGFPETAIGMPLNLWAPHPPIHARKPAAKPILFQGAVEGHVLVKNDHGALPLKSPKLLSVFGYDAVSPSSMDIPSSAALYGLDSWVLGYESIGLQDGLFALAGLKSFPLCAMNGTIVSGGGSGANSPAYISAPFDALQERVYADGTSLFWDFTSQNPGVDPASDACLVFVNAFAAEAADRTALSGTGAAPYKLEYLKHL